MSEDILDTVELRVKAKKLRAAAEACELAASQIESVAADGGELVGGRELIDRAQDVVDPDEAVHYREIESRLRAIGVVPWGSNPANTLLTALNRSPHFSREGSRTGIYRRHAPVDHVNPSDRDAEMPWLISPRPPR